MTPQTPNPDSNESQGGVLLALAARCEAATGADREIDLAIWRIMDPMAEQVEATGRQPLAWLHCYTSSVDRALTLVPDGWSISMHLSENGLYPCVKMGRSYPTNANVAQEGATLPLAICAGSLRARSLSGEGGRA